MPGFLAFQNSFWKGGSVAAFCVTSNCIRVSFCFKSAAEGFSNFIVAPLVFVFCTGVVVATWEEAGEQPLTAKARITNNRNGMRPTCIIQLKVSLASEVRKDPNACCHP